MYQQPLTHPPRILISRLSAHGDVIQTLPLLTAVKRAWPDAVIGWVVEASAVPLLQNHPLIDHLHVSKRKDWARRLLNPLNWPSVLREITDFVDELRAMRYELGLDVQGLFKSAVWPWLAGVPVRYGFRNTREFGDRFYTHPLAPHDLHDPDTPITQVYLRFAEALGIDAGAAEFVCPPVSTESRNRVATWLKDSQQPTIALAPFTRWPSKHWVQDNWPRLIERLQAQGRTVILLGAATDCPVVDSWLAALPETDNVINLTGETDWPDLYALFERVDVLIGLDSAPLHIANAVGHPRIISLFGSTAPNRSGPIGEEHITLTAGLECQPCFERVCPLGTDACMKALSVEAVMEALDQQLAGQKEAPL